MNLLIDIKELECHRNCWLNYLQAKRNSDIFFLRDMLVLTPMIYRRRRKIFNYSPIIFSSSDKITITSKLINHWEVFQKWRYCYIYISERMSKGTGTVVALHCMHVRNGMTHPVKWAACSLGMVLGMMISAFKISVRDDWGLIGIRGGKIPHSWNHTSQT